MVRDDYDPILGRESQLLLAGLLHRRARGSPERLPGAAPRPELAGRIFQA